MGFGKGRVYADLITTSESIKPKYNKKKTMKKAYQLIRNQYKVYKKKKKQIETQQTTCDKNYKGTTSTMQQPSQSTATLYVVR